MDEPALFEAVPQEPLSSGEKVRIQTMWGHEQATVVDVHHEDTHPVATVITDSGDRITVSVARLARL